VDADGAEDELVDADGTGRSLWMTTAWGRSRGGRRPTSSASTSSCRSARS
jgi:hypothetical protein